MFTRFYKIFAGDNALNGIIGIIMTTKDISQFL